MNKEVLYFFHKIVELYLVFGDHNFPVSLTFSGSAYISQIPIVWIILVSVLT